jgi:hypothetical protein
MWMRIHPAERLAMLASGMLGREPFFCSECGRPIEPGAMALCADGYQRVYGEFVLSNPGAEEAGYEDNWPEAHAACLPEGKAGYGEPPRAS